MRFCARLLAAATAACAMSVVVGCTSASSTGVTLQTPSPTASSAVQPGPPAVSTSQPVAVSSSSSATAPPPTTAPTSPRVSTSPESTVIPPSSAKPADQESADRKSIEAVWSKYGTVGATLARLPAGERNAAISPYAVDPALAQILAAQANFAKNGWVTYGTNIHHPYWPAPVAGKATAVMGDCMDDSKAGSMEAKTGKKLTVGVPRDNTRVTVVKVAGGSWKVQKIEYLVNQPC